MTDLKPVVETEDTFLTKSEGISLSCIAQGMSAKEESRARNREQSTVNTQRQTMMRKFGVKNVLAVLAMAIGLGIVRYELPEEVDVTKVKKNSALITQLKNLVVVVLVGLSGFYGVMPSEAYSRPLFNTEPDTQLEFTRINPRPPRDIIFRTGLRKGKGKRSKQCGEADFYLAEK